MDERDLAELFRTAADDAPAATFWHSDVVAASRRATLRRRSALAGGSAFGVAVLLGGVLFGSGLVAGSGGDDAAAEADGASEIVPNVEEYDSGDTAAEPGTDESDGPDSRSQHEDSGEAPAELPDGTGTKIIPWPGVGENEPWDGCGAADAELADVLLAELPEAGDPVPVSEACPLDARAVAVPVLDGAAAGRLYVVLAPVAGSPASEPVTRAEDGATGHQLYTPKGQLLMVLSVPAEHGGQPPFAERTARLAEVIGGRY